MKNKLVSLILFAAALCVTASAQPAPAATESLVRIQSEVSSGDVTAFFEKSVTVDSVTYRQPWESVSWNASQKTVTVAGQALTYAQVMQYVVAIAAQERAEQKAAQAAAAANPPQDPPPAPDLVALPMPIHGVTNSDAWSAWRKIYQPSASDYVLVRN